MQKRFVDAAMGNATDCGPVPVSRKFNDKI